MQRVAPAPCVLPSGFAHPRLSHPQAKSLLKEQCAKYNSPQHGEGSSSASFPRLVLSSRPEASLQMGLQGRGRTSLHKSWGRASLQRGWLLSPPLKDPASRVPASCRSWGQHKVRTTPSHPSLAFTRVTSVTGGQRCAAVAQR